MVSHSFALMRALISLDILSIDFLQNSSGISRIQTNLIASIRAGILGDVFRQLYALKSPKLFDEVTIGTVAGPLQESNFIKSKKSVTIFVR